MSLLLAIFLFFAPQIANAQVTLSEISPTTETEWIEMYNPSDSVVILTGWKLQTETSTRNIPDNTQISAASYYIFETSSFLTNSVPKTVKLIDQSGTQIDAASPYPVDLSASLSWSKQSDFSWCQTNPTKFAANNSCLIPTATPTPAPTNTPVPTNTSVPSGTPTPSNTPSPTAIPSVTNTPAPTSEPIHISIDNIPSSASLGNTFLVRFIVNHASPNTDYYVKAYGGINDNYYLETQNGTSWYGFSAAWDNLPKFKSDSSGNINQLLFVRAKTDKEIGNYKVKVKLRDPETESEIKYITITKFVPSPTPTKIEPTPTTEYIPTPEPLPTSLPEVNTKESTPVLGSSDQEDLSPANIPAKTSNSTGNIIPIILITTGGVLLLVPLLISKIRSAKKI